MARRVNRVSYQLDSGNIKSLPDEEIKCILRAADPLINLGGRNLLAKILKGSKDKSVLEKQLDQCPVYGCFSQLTIEEITKKIDFLIRQDYLRIVYDYRLPLIVYSDKGWLIEKETYCDEWLVKLKKLDEKMLEQLKNVNNQVKELMIEKIVDMNDSSYLPYLKIWQSIESKRNKKMINQAITHLKEE